uniref:Metalloendopeptidase n=1 Tax=Globodera rostochiensis TaxID=31243 RepID=A0A914I3V9_GLORO
MILLTFLLLVAALKAFGVYGTEPPDKIWNMCKNDLLTLDKNLQSLLICYKSKLAKDSGNWKVGGRFRVNSPNEGLAYECAGNDGTKGWHAVHIGKEHTGIVTLDASFGRATLGNASNYPEINIINALTTHDHSVGVDFLNALRFGAFMRDFNAMAFQIAALEIRRSTRKKDIKLCKTKTTPVIMPKAQHVNHRGISCMQIEFPTDIPNFSLNISASVFGLACEEHEKHIDTENYDKKKQMLYRANACAQVPTSKCNKSVEMFVCYRSKSQLTGYRNSILAKCQLLLGKAPNVAGIRVQICIHREADEQMLVVESKIEFSFTEMIHNSTRKFSIKPGETSETSFALKRDSFPIFFIEFGNERHTSFIDDKNGGKDSSSNWDKENATIATVLNSIADEQINGSWTKTLLFVPPPNEYMKIFFKLSSPEFTKLITRQPNSMPYEDNPNKKHPSKCDALGEHCEQTRDFLMKVDEMREWCAPLNPNPSETCLGPRQTPTPEELGAFTRPPWDQMPFPSTEIPPTDKGTDDPLKNRDVLYSKEQAQKEYDDFVNECARCRNSSKLETEPRRHKRQFALEAFKWQLFPIPIKFNAESLGDRLEFARISIKLGVMRIMENTCVNFTFDTSTFYEGIQVIDSGDRKICGWSMVGQYFNWQKLSINCYVLGTGAHELLHALGLHHEDQRNDAYSYIKLNPFEKDYVKMTENYGLPYDYGSLMHYPHQWGPHNTYKRITLNRFYQQTIGQNEMPSFKDYAIINQMYCNESCGTENLCQNGGYHNPKRCSECYCPDGYGGKRCETLEEDKHCNHMVGPPRELKANWKARRCHWRIKPQDGKRVRIQLKRLNLTSQCRAMTKGDEAQNFAARMQLPKCLRPKTGLRQKSPARKLSFPAHLNRLDNVSIELTYETDGAKIVRSNECPDPLELFIKKRNPGQSVKCVEQIDKPGKVVACPQGIVIFKCDSISDKHFAVLNGRQTNKTRVTLECFKREDNPTNFWSYWDDKDQDPIHIDDMQCVEHHTVSKFKSAEVEDFYEIANETFGYMVAKYNMP